jgi:predicted MPP superfamily phosphohydrolase
MYDTRSVTFMHLSDIHFMKKSGAVLDLDVELREQLESDAELMRIQLGNITGILVTGDIAYSGNQKEYEHALIWLGKLCDILHCDKKNVWVTPGNHDVQRDKVEKSKPLKDQHATFRKLKPREVDKELEATLEDETYSKLIYTPIDAYVKFASKFSCTIDSEKLTWEDSIYLNDGTLLKLHGLNSTIISDKNDDNGANKLILGSHQVKMARNDEVVNVSLCHHPMDWLLDGDNINQALFAKVKIQLFGHKHALQLQHISNGENQQTLKIVAGAVHPERRESDWRPCYNYISLSVEQTEVRKLKVLVYQRKWDDEERKFIAVTSKQKKEDFIDFYFPLPPLGADERVSRQMGHPAHVPTEVNMAESVVGRAVGNQGESVMDPERELAFKFLTLPYHEIMAVAQELDLLEDDDDGLLDFQLYEEMFKRASSSGKLKDLWCAVLEKHGEDCKTNPFDKHD